MKTFARQVWCLLLVASFLFQPASAVFAQACQNRGAMSAVYAALVEARGILSSDTGAKGSQDAVPALERAKHAAFAKDFVREFPGKVSSFQADIEKARLKVLWNDRSEALSIVNRLLGILDDGCKGAANPCGNGPGAGVALGTTLIAGLGIVFVGLFFGLGQVSHR